MVQTMKRLTRSRHNRVFAGICGGLAAYLGWDVVLVRMGWVALTIFSAGSGIALYLLAWLIIPLAEPGSPSIEPPDAIHPTTPKSNTRLVIGILAVVVGLLALSSAFLPWFWSLSSFRVIGPVVLILIGAVLLIRSSESAKRPMEQQQSDTTVPPHLSSTAAGDAFEASKAKEQSSEAARGARPQPRLVRLHSGRKIAGVCVGIGEHFDMDPTIVRLLFVVLLLVGGIGLILYILLWMVMPLVENGHSNPIH